MLDNKVMKVSFKKGLSYGTTSGVITSLGLLIGLYSSASPKSVILAGLLTIAFADAFSDGLGIRMSEESEDRFSNRSIWEATISTIVAKMVLGLSFVIPIIIFDITNGVLFDILWGILVLTGLSYLIAKQNKEKIYLSLFKHMSLVVFVIIGSFTIGKIIESLFR